MDREAKSEGRGRNQRLLLAAVLQELYRLTMNHEQPHTRKPKSSQSSDQELAISCSWHLVRSCRCGRGTASEGAAGAVDDAPQFRRPLVWSALSGQGYCVESVKKHFVYIYICIQL